MIQTLEVVKQILAGKRQMIRAPRNGTKPPWRVGRRYEVRGSKERTCCTVTCTAVEPAMFAPSPKEPERPVWVLRFVRGDLTDTPRLLAARPGGSEGDYTSTPARALGETGEEVSKDWQEKYTTAGLDSHADILSEQRRRALEAIREIRRHAPTGTAQKRLRNAEYQLRALDAETSV